MAKRKKTVKPDINYEDGKNLYKINTTPELPTYTSTLLNDVNQWARGSKAENVGQVSELIKQFRQDNPKGGLEDWKKYHRGKTGHTIQILRGKGSKKKEESIQMAGIDQGVEDIMKKLEEVKKSINGLTKDDVLKWLENLVYEKTYCGLEAQELILKNIAKKNSMDYMLGSIEDEKQGIDGYIINDKDGDLSIYPLQIKSSSYGNKHKQEHFLCPIVTYELKKDGIKYNLPNTALTNPQNTDEWNAIKERTKQRYIDSK